MRKTKRQCHSSGAMYLASEIAADEDQIGHRSAAQLLRGSLNPNGRHSGLGSPNSTSNAYASILSNALSEVTKAGRLGDVVLTPKARENLQEVVTEWHNRDRLQTAGLSHRSKLIFHGPPGCGKSLAAAALGAELGIPTFVVRFDAVIGAYLGQTALHLRELFRHAERCPTVLVFDEVDALGKKRGSPLDVGELDRIVIALMQELEHCHAQGLVIATTNLASNLDSALWRRFDLAVQFPKPTERQLTKYVRTLERSARLRLSPSARKLAIGAASFADAEQVVLSEARRSLLRNI